MKRLRFLERINASNDICMIMLDGRLPQRHTLSATIWRYTCPQKNGDQIYQAGIGRRPDGRVSALGWVGTQVEETVDCRPRSRCLSLPLLEAGHLEARS